MAYPVQRQIRRLCDCFSFCYAKNTFLLSISWGREGLSGGGVVTIAHCKEASQHGPCRHSTTAKIVAGYLSKRQSSL